MKFRAYYKSPGVIPQVSEFYSLFSFVLNFITTMQTRNNNNNNRQLRKKQKRSVKPLTLQSARLTHPPNYTSQSVRSFRIRGITTASISGYQALMTDLAGFLGVVAKTTTSSNYLSSLTRLRRITFWAPVATAGTPVTVSLTWTNNSEDFETPPLTRSDTSISFDYPAFLDMRPPKGSLNSKWHSSGLTDAMFVFSCPSGTTIDFELDWVLCDGVDVASVSGPALVAATVGLIYHHPFSNLVPIGNLNVL